MELLTMEEIARHNLVEIEAQIITEINRIAEEHG